MRMNAAGVMMNKGYTRNTGYGRFGYELHNAMFRAGVKDYGPVGVNEQEMGPPEAVGPVAFYAATPPHVLGWHEGQTGVIFTMWEFSEMPVGFRENIPEFDRVFVPSLQNLELFSHFNADVRYVPLAVDRAWHYQERPDPSERFNFFTGGAGPRKGCYNVITAFEKVFKGWKPSWGPEPHLTVRASNVYRPDVSHNLASHTGFGGRTSFGDDRIHYLQGFVSDQAEVDLYAKMHCFVSGSKGEGWGFMPHQAIAQGMPTILAPHSGHAAFAHRGIPIGYKLRTPEIHTHWGAAGMEWDPNFDEMCEAMKDVYDNYEAHAFRAKFNAIRIADDFSWEQTAASVIEQIPELWGRDVSPNAPWKLMPQRLYPVRVQWHDTWNVNGQLRTYDPGFLYQLPWADKLRLAETGNLDPSCVDPREVGVDPRMQPPTDAPTHCPHCNQKYGSDRTFLELQDKVSHG